MSDPTLLHHFNVGDRIRGRADAGPNDRRFRGVVTDVGPHIVGHARDVTAQGYWLEDDGRQSPAWIVGNGTEFELWE